MREAPTFSQRSRSVKSTLSCFTYCQGHWSPPTWPPPPLPKNAAWPAKGPLSPCVSCTRFRAGNTSRPQVQRKNPRTTSRARLRRQLGVHSPRPSVAGAKVTTGQGVGAAPGTEGSADRVGAGCVEGALEGRRHPVRGDSTSLIPPEGAAWATPGPRARLRVTRSGPGAAATGAGYSGPRPPAGPPG